MAHECPGTWCLLPLPGLGTQPPSAVVADTPAGWAGRAAWPGVVGAAVAVFLLALALLPIPGGAPRRTPTAPAAACIAASTSGGGGEGCTSTATTAPLSRPAALPVAVPPGTLTAGDPRFLAEKIIVPTLGPDPHIPTTRDFREDHRVPMATATGGAGSEIGFCQVGTSPCAPDGAYPPPVTHGNGPADEYGAP